MNSLLKRHRLLGTLFVGVLALAVWLVAAIFNQTFSKFDDVTLEAGTAGLQLPERADVKIRGVIVGQVQDMRAGGSEGAIIDLGIKPDEIDQIPDNVTAQIVPKTLFGEKFVDLVVPSDPSPKPLAAGQTIKQTEMPVEVERVLNDLYPLLRSIQPAELNYTLNALATALEGRGEKIGESIETLDGYLRRFNPELPALIDDLELLVTVTDTYADVFPDLARVLRNVTLTGNTLVEKEQTLNAFLRDLTSFSDTTTGFLDDNGNNIIRLAKLSEPTLALLAQYSSTYPCLLRGIVKQAPRLASTFRDFIFHIDLNVITNNLQPYDGGDRQVFGAANSPNCAGLPNPPIPYPRFPNIDDGVNGIGKGGQRTAPGFGRPVASPASAAADEPVTVGGVSRSKISVGPSGTPSQKAMLNSILSPLLGTPVEEMSDVSTLLFAPALAGTEVNMR